MTIDTALVKLYEKWRAAEVTLRPGVTDKQIGEFESKYEVALPDDYRHFLKTTDGMNENEVDNDMFTIWELSRVKTCSELYPSPKYRKFEASDLAFCFADWCLNGHVYVMELTNRSKRGCKFWGLVGREIQCHSFTQFIELLVVDSPQLHW